MNTKKCPNCGEWSKWNLSLHDKCEHCGELLQKQEALKEKEKIKEIEKQEKEFIFHIDKTDNFLQKALKKGGYAVYVVIMSVVSFITWLLFWLGP